MASLTHLDAPGAYPATPVNEEPTRQTHHNKLHKREDPRGAGDSVPQRQHPSGLNSTSSGIPVKESSLAYGADQPASSHHNPLHHTSFNENKETPRSLGKDEQYRSHRFTDSGIDVGDAPISRENAKPGVMTGAYSRVGTRDSSFAPVGDYTYDQSSALKPQNGLKPEYSAATTPVGNLVAPANTPAEPTNPDLDTNTTTNLSAGYRDESQGGSHENSNTQRNEPYWGDLPFGAGVYNGVTGHGSNESTAHHKSPHDQIGASANTGVYNGVTGHGSDEILLINNEHSRFPTTLTLQPFPM
ncbi:hypothetical protein O1611_g3493 [Lasiodiplodia mahajangana]|uniref:Uncharacterized protein n=1 Tax=Lasiodiplodia mahajangana TaxID=1108764 RepID=A0ACC2JS97_9PEZI|nr:hypothetical protein O1611_g3493 [Lasiodiplodia mahajangana]